MMRVRTGPIGSGSLSRKLRARCAVLALTVGALVLAAGCDDEEALRAFRGAAASSLQTGLSSILDGLVDGLFAVIQMGDDQDSDTSSSGSSGSS